ncbi:MAG: DUF192 domain-containing protein [Solirubrobacterales bacterium]
MAGYVVVRDADLGGIVCERCELADGVWSRFRGLQLRAGLEPGQGLLLRPCGSVHTFFMRFAIDVVFLDAGWRILGVRERLGPWRTAAARGAREVLELPAGEAGRLGLERGDWLAIDEPGVGRPREGS